jgi:hypothetical protein
MKLKAFKNVVFIGLFCLVFCACSDNKRPEQSDPNLKDSIQGEAIPFQRTGFSETCQAISKVLKDTANRAGKTSYFDGKSYGNISFDSLGSILAGIFLFDQSNTDYHLYSTNCKGLKTFIWKQPSKGTPMIKKQSYRALAKLLSDSGKIQILLTDYMIYRNDFPKLIELRVMDSTSITQLLIDDNVFTPAYEGVPVNIQKVYATFDSIKAICKN